MTKPDENNPLRIGLLGGSFNPAHDGHLEISLHALNALTLDAVWWLVSPGNPLKDPAEYVAYDERLKFATEFCKNTPIHVSDFERVHDTQFTVDTLNTLKTTYSDYFFTWLMGADSLATFHRWKDWRVIAQLVPLAVFNRPGFEEAPLKSDAALVLQDHRLANDSADDLVTHTPPAWRFFPAPNNPISSTQIRNSI